MMAEGKDSSQADALRSPPFNITPRESNQANGTEPSSGLSEGSPRSQEVEGSPLDGARWKRNGENPVCFCFVLLHFSSLPQLETNKF